MQCGNCFKWVRLKCLHFFFSRFKILHRSHSWNCPLCCVSVFPGGPTPTNNVSSSLDSSNLYTSTVLPGPSGPHCQCSAPAHPHLHSSYSSSAYSASPNSSPSPSSHDSGCFLISPASSSPLTREGSAMEYRRSSSQKINYYTLSRLIL